MRITGMMALSVFVGLAGCTSGPGGNDVMASMSSGVGFGDYQRYLREREAAQRSAVPYSVPPETARAMPPVATAPLPAPGAIMPSAATLTATPLAPAPVGAPIAAPLTTAPLATPVATGAPLAAPMAPLQPTAAPRTAAPAFGTTPAFDPGPSVRPGLSDEQDFNAVAARETIESDRERLARQRAQYQIVAVDSVPDASVRTGPNVVAYALATTHPVGATQYRRLNPLRWSRWEASCLRFHNQDAAQEAFLAAGGPERDPEHLDPDGDGYACWWDPTPIRQVARAGQ